MEGYLQHLRALSVHLSLRLYFKLAKWLSCPSVMFDSAS